MSNKNDNMKKKIATGILIGTSITGIASSAVLAANTSTTVDNEVANTVMDSVSTTKGRSKRSDVADRESLKEYPAKPPKNLLKTKLQVSTYVFRHNGGDYQKLENNKFQDFFSGGYSKHYYGYVTDLNKTNFNVFIGLFDIGGKLYCADNNGNLLTGIQKIGDDLYYFGEKQTDAYARRGWVTLGNDSYYFDVDGKAAKGFREIEGITFYFDKYGKRVRDLHISENGDMYYFKGRNQVFGFQTIDDKQFYFDKNRGGIAVKNDTLELGGIMYEFDKDGVCTGMYKILD